MAFLEWCSKVTLSVNELGVWLFRVGSKVTEGCGESQVQRSIYKMTMGEIGVARNVM